MHWPSRPQVNNPSWPSHMAVLAFRAKKKKREAADQPVLPATLRFTTLYTSTHHPRPSMAYGAGKGRPLHACRQKETRGALLQMQSCASSHSASFHSSCLRHMCNTTAVDWLQIKTLTIALLHSLLRSTTPSPPRLLPSPLS